MNLQYLSDKKVMVTGGAGFLGLHVSSLLKNYGLPESQIIVPRSKEVDFRNQEETFQYFEKVKADVVISLAARLGGIGDNRVFPASYFYDNLMIGINVIEASRRTDAKKLVLIGTVCSYPKFVPVPFMEEDLWNGFPEETNAGYGVSKKAVGLYAETCTTQYGMNNVNLLVTNLYGPGDDFREQTSHVIPAIIKKIIQARDKNEPHIIAWGDGSPSRDFVYVGDAARGIIQAAEKHNDCKPINIGAGEEYTVKQLIETLCNLLDYKGEVVWDTTKPNGQPRRLLSIEKAQKNFGFYPQTPFHEGLKNTVEWYLKNREYLDSLPAKFS